MHVVSIQDFSLANVSPFIMNQRTSTGSGPAVTYSGYKISYRYPVAGEGVTENKCLVKLGDFTLERGLQLPNPAYAAEGTGRGNVRLELSGPSGKKSEGFFTGLADMAADAITKDKGRVGAFGKKFTNREMCRGMLSPPVTYKTDQDGNVDTSFAAIKYLTLDEYEGRMNTKFVIPIGTKKGFDGRRVVVTKEIPAAVLYNKTLEVTPTVWAKRVFVGNVASVQFFLSSMIVKSISENVIAPVIENEMEEFADANPEALAKLAQFAADLDENPTAMLSTSSSIAADSGSAVGVPEEPEVPDWAKPDAPVEKVAVAPVEKVATPVKVAPDVEEEDDESSDEEDAAPEPVVEEPVVAEVPTPTEKPVVRRVRKITK